MAESDTTDRVVIGIPEYERLKVAEETCWSLFLAIGLGEMEEVPVSVRQWIVEGGMDRWSRLCAEQGLMSEEEDHG